MSAAWPFAEPRNEAVITLRSVMLGTSQILFVSRAADDGMWQFMSGEKFEIADALIVGLGEVFKHDPSVGKLADLSPGWEASRRSPDSPWVRAVSPPEEDD